MSFTDRAARMHARVFLRMHGAKRTYRRADGSSAEILLARTLDEREERDDRGVVVIVRADDWLCSPTDFRRAFGANAEPQDEDNIVDNGRAFVVKPQAGDECFRSEDSTGRLWRIHAKDMGLDE